jgi:hypothetical protein
VIGFPESIAALSRISIKSERHRVREATWQRFLASFSARLLVRERSGPLRTGKTSSCRRVGWEHWLLRSYRDRMRNWARCNRARCLVFLIVAVEGLISVEPGIVTMGPDESNDATGPASAMVGGGRKDFLSLEVRRLMGYPKS